MTPHVLVVEDEIDLADLLVHSLQREHFAADAVGTGEEAVRRLARDPPDTDVEPVERQATGSQPVRRAAR